MHPKDYVTIYWTSGHGCVNDFFNRSVIQIDHIICYDLKSITAAIISTEKGLNRHGTSYNLPGQTNHAQKQ